MAILEVNKRKVDLGFAKILIGNISLGGMKIITPLKLPINSNMTFKFHFTLICEPFEIQGSLVCQNKGTGYTYDYGIKFDIKNKEEERLESIINKMTTLKNDNKNIHSITKVYKNHSLYYKKN